MKDKRIIMSIMWLVIGITLICLEIAGIIDDFWGGMGFALTFVGILQMIRYYRYSRNEEYREKMEIEASDERNHFIRNKAWAWTGYVFILIAAAATIIFKVVGQDVLSMAASGAVCLMLILYWGIYMILRKKY